MSRGAGLLLALLLTLLLGWPAPAQAVVVEMLRLQVPRPAQAAWLAAERICWEPWLRRQDGFLGRELLYDPRQEEALVLIRWASRRQWQAIPPAEVARLDRRFQAEARRRLGPLAPAGGGSPFALLQEGDLRPMDATP
ncbi:MAG: TIGR03792 family protein [Cyanobacteriota bacterium]|nr:TIGR03792 family protein [Cyanobacteriota bacterium]